MLKLQSAVTRDLPARCPHCQAWLVHERTCSEAGVVRDLQRFDSAFLSVTESSPSRRPPKTSTSSAPTRADPQNRGPRRKHRRGPRHACLAACPGHHPLDPDEGPAPPSSK